MSERSLEVGEKRGYPSIHEWRASLSTVAEIEHNQFSNSGPSLPTYGFRPCSCSCSCVPSGSGLCKADRSDPTDVEPRSETESPGPIDGIACTGWSWLDLADSGEKGEPGADISSRVSQESSEFNRRCGGRDDCGEAADTCGEMSISESPDGWRLGDVTLARGPVRDRDPWVLAQKNSPADNGDGLPSDGGDRSPPSDGISAREYSGSGVDNSDRITPGSGDGISAAGGCPGISGIPTSLAAPSSAAGVLPCLPAWSIKLVSA